MTAAAASISDVIQTTTDSLRSSIRRVDSPRSLLRSDSPRPGVKSTSPSLEAARSSSPSVDASENILLNKTTDTIYHAVFGLADRVIIPYIDKADATLLSDHEIVELGGNVTSEFKPQVQSIIRVVVGKLSPEHKSKINKLEPGLKDYTQSNYLKQCVYQALRNS